MRGPRYYAKRLRRRRRPIRFLLARMLWLSAFVRLFRLRIDRGPYRLRFHPAKLAADLWADPRLLRPEDRLLRAYLRSGDTVVDVGANIGTETLTAALAVGERGRVFSIEPQRRIFRYLSENIELNGVTNVRAFNLAVAEADGSVRISDGLYDTGSRIVPDGGVRASARRLDGIIVPGEAPTIDLLKIDVEGSELSVLRGAPRVLSRTRCVYFEHIPHHFTRYGSTERDIFAIVQASGFGLYRIRDDPTNVLAVRSIDAFRARVAESAARLELMPIPIQV